MYRMANKTQSIIVLFSCRYYVGRRVVQASKNVQPEVALVHRIVFLESYLLFSVFFRKEMHNFEGCYFYNYS